MLIFGIDVLMLALFGIILVLASYVISALIPLYYEEGLIVVRTTAITVVLMVVGYIIVSHVLDYAFGPYGW